jgi:arylsulfatase A-like enzyme
MVESSRKTRWLCRSAADALATLAACVAAAAGEPERLRANLIMVMVDTLRADRLSAYGYRRATSPELERLAAQGTLFLDVFSDSPWTKPAIASLFTGYYPPLHQILDGSIGPGPGAATMRVLGPRADTLAERLAAGGYRTIAVSTNPHVRRDNGMLQGFEKAREASASSGGAAVYLMGMRLLVEAALERDGWATIASGSHQLARPPDCRPAAILELAPQRGAAAVCSIDLEAGRPYVIGARTRLIGGSNAALRLTLAEGRRMNMGNHPKPTPEQRWLEKWELILPRSAGRAKLEAQLGPRGDGDAGRFEIEALGVVPLAALAQPAAPPVFLYLHLMDIHAPYAPPHAQRGRYLADPELDPRIVPADQLLKQLGVGEERRLGAISALYDAQINAWDQELAQFLGQIEPLLPAARTILVVLADHGEGFMEHGLMNHGNSLYQELLRVPLYFRGPGIAAGRRIATTAALVDLLPTLIELAGLAEPEESSGISLAPWLRLDPPPPPNRRVFAILQPNPRSERVYGAVREGSWKLIRLGLEGAASRELLFDLERDPAEQSDLAAREPERLAALRELLQQWHAQLGARGRALRLSELTSPSREQLERLRSLGYVQ